MTDKMLDVLLVVALVTLIFIGAALGIAAYNIVTDIPTEYVTETTDMKLINDKLDYIIEKLGEDK